MIIILSLILIGNIDAADHNPVIPTKSLATHEITIDASSWISFPVYCQSGDTLSGEFVVKKDGELFPGDQTEYDLSLLTGINFLILDEENYDLWIEDSPSTPIFDMKTIVQLIWSIEIPHEGIWYVIYVNDTVYMKEIEGSIVHPSSDNGWFIVFGIAGVVVSIGLAYIFWKKSRAVAA